MYGETDILLVNYSNGYYLFSGQLIKELEAFRPEELYKAEDGIYFCNREFLCYGKINKMFIVVKNNWVTSCCVL